MKVIPKIDRKTGEIVLLYKGEGSSLNAEVYKFHGGENKIATHFSAQGVRRVYVYSLSDPTVFDEINVSAAIAFFEDIRREKIVRSVDGSLY